jgi:hypothetical protein
VIGTLGESGTEGSPHLHYEVSKHEGGDPIGDLIDPVPYMNRGGTGAQHGHRAGRAGRSSSTCSAGTSRSRCRADRGG